MHEFYGKRAKTRALKQGENTMYRGKDRETGYLFKELCPFGGKLNENNRWMKISKLLPWKELENKYRSYFSDKGRPGLDGRLVVGLLLLKHMTGASDRDVVQTLSENPYWQMFCGFDSFVTEPLLEASSLTKMRKRLGLKYIKELEGLTYKTLIDRKIIKGKGMLADGTIFPEDIKYPNDVGLLNDVRKWLEKNIKELGRKIGRKYRTYSRKAKKTYLKFSKTRKKTGKMIRRARREMLQYVRRNIRQLTEVIEIERAEADEVLKERFEIGRKIYEQQMKMHKEKLRRVKDRIVSFQREYVRPMKRGKAGKNVEFGPKGALSYVDGFLFLDKFDHNNFSEAETKTVEGQIKNYQDKFGKVPPSFAGDQLYGNRGNRKLMRELGIKSAFRPLGRQKEKFGKDRWCREKQKERNRIEGSFGNGKEHYRLDRIRYHGTEGAEMWVRSGILGMNLKMALAKV